MVALVQQAAALPVKTAKTAKTAKAPKTAKTAKIAGPIKGPQAKMNILEFCSFQ